MCCLCDDPEMYEARHGLPKRDDSQDDDAYDRQVEKELWEEAHRGKVKVRNSFQRVHTFLDEKVVIQNE